MTPRILIPVPWHDDAEYSRQCWPEYARAVTESGGEAVEVPLTYDASELEKLVAGADGVLLPGSGADVDPARYGHPRIEACNTADPLREATDFALLAAAERLGKPALCICFGAQSLNVHRGGTLVQDLPPMPVNHRAGRAVAVAHTALVAVDSRLGRISAQHGQPVPDGTEWVKIPVNSSHHQALHTPGENLRITARGVEDGVIEAVETGDPDHWLVGVQWHPERTFDTNPISRALFAAFLNAAGRRG